MFAIRDMQSAGRVIMWVKKEPKHLPKEQYVEVDDVLYERLKRATFWIDDNGNFTFEKPHTYKYHVFQDRRWRLDHEKVSEHLDYIKQVFKNNIVTYKEMGYDEKRCEFLNSQIDKIKTLDDMEEFALISIGGKYASVYSKRYNVAI